MINASQLEDAIQYRDQLKKLLIFRKGYTDWRGPVSCQFGSYTVTFSAACIDEINAALDTEERQLRNTLEMFGIKTE